MAIQEDKGFAGYTPLDYVSRETKVQAYQKTTVVVVVVGLVRCCPRSGGEEDDDDDWVYDNKKDTHYH